MTYGSAPCHIFATSLCLAVGACGASTSPPQSHAAINAEIDAIEVAATKPAISRQPPLVGVKPQPTEVTTIQAFEASAFCKQYACANHKSWALRTGGTNHSYELNLTPSVSVEVPTKGEHINDYGVVFFERDRLGEPELQVVDTLLRAINTSSATAAIRQFVRNNIERDAFQIRQAKSTTLGRYRLWAGKVGGQQTVSIEPVSPKDNGPQTASSTPAAISPPPAPPAPPTTSAADSNSRAVDAMVTQGLIKRMDLKTGNIYIWGELWEGFELDAKQQIVKVISRQRETEQRLPQVTLYESRSGKELASYGVFSGVTIK